MRHISGARGSSCPDGYGSQLRMPCVSQHVCPWHSSSRPRGPRPLRPSRLGRDGRFARTYGEHEFVSQAVFVGRAGAHPLMDGQRANR